MVHAGRELTDFESRYAPYYAEQGVRLDGSQACSTGRSSTRAAGFAE